MKPLFENFVANRLHPTLSLRLATWASYLAKPNQARCWSVFVRWRRESAKIESLVTRDNSHAGGRQTMRRTLKERRAPSTRYRRSRLLRRSDCVQCIGPDDTLDQRTIAELSSELIAMMNREELIRVVVASRLISMRPALREHVRYSDHATLQRLAHLGRRCCRNLTADNNASLKKPTHSERLRVCG